MAFLESKSTLDYRTGIFISLHSEKAKNVPVREQSNAQTMWVALSNLIIGAEADLVLAEAFKALEPTGGAAVRRFVAINEHYFIPDRRRPCRCSAS